MHREPAVPVGPVSLPGGRQIPRTECPSLVGTIHAANGYRVMAAHGSL